MKDLGTVKWFGGYSSRFDKILDYGFIKVGDDDVFLHKRNINEALLKDLKEGALLLLDIEKNNENKFMAINIEVFNIYNYFELISELNSKEAIEVILRDLVTLNDNATEYEKYLKQIPEKFIIESKLIRNKVDYKTVLAKLAGLFSVINDPGLIKVLDEFLINELEENLFYKEGQRKKYSYINTSENRQVTVEYTSDIRILVQNSSVLYKYLDSKSKYKYLIELCMENLVLDYKKLTEELEEVVNEDPRIYVGEYCKELNNLYKNSDLFYIKLSEIDKVKFLFENYEQDGDLEYLVSKFELLDEYYIHNFNYKEDLYLIISRSDSIFESLNITCKIEYLSRHYEENADRDYIIEKFKNLYVEEVEIDTLNKLPHNIIECEDVWNKLSEYLKIRHYLEKEKELTSEQILEMERYYEDIEAFEKIELDEIISDNLELRIRFSKLIMPEKQVIMFFEKLIEWPSLTWESQIMAIYKISKENLDFGFLREYKSDILKNKLVHAACKILFAKNVADKNKEFLESHDLLQDYVVERAWNLNDKINLDVILPICEKNKNSNYIRYCDCKPWNRKSKSDDDMETEIEEETIYCPYKRKEVSQPCYIESYGTSCAKLAPEMYREWSEWTFKELIYNSGIKPLLDTKKMECEYINKISGWINRLNEVRKRLRCSHCNEVCRPNYKYSKKLAKFNMTIITCIEAQRLGEHDENVYLNQCWNCQEIIDSRESKIKMEEYYLCLKCGAGPQLPKEYVQGSVCPKCGSGNMERYTPNIRNLYNQLLYFKCKDCGHEIDTRRRF